MITTVTLNVAVDKLYIVDKLSSETVMRVTKVQNTAGGKGLNVARVASQIGEHVRALGFIGGYNGEYVRSMLETQGIETYFTEINGETRSCINVRDMSAGKHTEFLEPGASVTTQQAEQLYLEYQKSLSHSSIVTISGSVPAGMPEGFYGRLIKAAKAADIKVILDTSGALLVEGVAAVPYMIKPNAEEIAQLLGKKVDTKEALIAAAEQLHGKGIAYVVVSLGKEGALMVCSAGVFLAAPPDVPVVNTVGCGDSMVAAFAVGLARGYSAQKLLEFASAVSTSNAQSIETGSVVLKDVEELEELVNITQIK